MARIYTKTGDSGETGLVGGDRVAKDDARVEAYGDVDELNAAIGAIRSQPACWEELDDTLSFLQVVLFELGADLATPTETKKRSGGVGLDDITRLEKEIDRVDANLPQLKSFVLPGGSPLASSLHLARAVCRRAERRCVSAQKLGLIQAPEPIVFLNRLSDLLFVLAREALVRSSEDEILWVPRSRS